MTDELKPGKGNEHKTDAPEGAMKAAAGLSMGDVPDREDGPQESGTKQPEPFDLDRYRLRQDFGSTIGVKKILMTVPVRKPDPQAFIRVHAGEAYTLSTALVNMKEEREAYLVDPSMYGEIADDLTPTMLFLAITRAGVPFLLPVPLPKPDGEWNRWHQSLFDAVQKAKKDWVRIAANRAGGFYDVYAAEGNLSEPEWPTETLDQLVRIAFRTRIIDSPDHLIARRLRGGA